MKNYHHLFSTLALCLGLSFSFTACQDNDIDAGGNGGNDDNTEVTDKEWQKQITLQCLLGAMADVDSLPDNWNDKSYVVTPTIGTAADDAAPYSVRNVVTTSSDEAYRIYRSLTASSIGSTATNDTWSMDGIGSMTFKTESQPNLYATLKVNVQQLPQLQEIRFVPSSAIGNNGGVSQGEPYYQFGDIVKQTLNGQDTYWVCVRPVGKKSNQNDKGRSHWCSFQLTPLYAKNPNYIQFSEKGYGDLTLPTGLCSKQADGVRMVQNFFNLLRIINNPNIYEKEKGIDDFKNNKEGFYNDTLRTISNIWTENHLWETITQDRSSALHSLVKDTLINMLNDRYAAINAFYYGYTKQRNLFKANGYKVYNLHMKTDANEEDDREAEREDKEVDKNPMLFNTVTPEMLDVTLENGVAKDFSQFTDGKNDNKKWLISSTYPNNNRGKYQFLVKYKSGGQLEERFLTGADDTDPTKSFTVTAPSKGFTDILVSRKEREKKFELPFITFGDIVTELKTPSKQPGDEHFCIKPCESRTANDGKDPYNYFINTQASNNDDSRTQAKQIDKVSENMMTYIAFHLLNAYVLYKTNYVIGENEKGYKQIYNNISGYLTTLPTLFQKFGQVDVQQQDYYGNIVIAHVQKHKAIKCSYVNEEKNGEQITYYSVLVGFYTGEEANTKGDGTLFHPTVIEMRYYPNAKEGEKAITYQILGKESWSYITNFLYVEKSKEEFSYESSYAKNFVRTIDDTTKRESLKKNFDNVYSGIFVPNSQKVVK